jgi:23S rRNA pseudouridine1911/1915/1917 synthase
VSASDLAPKIIFKDQSFVVVEKPAGLVVNRAKSVKGRTLQDWLEDKFSLPFLADGSDFWKRSGLVHRLDKETSGLILAARKPAAFANLQSQFKQRKVGKKYLALVHDRLMPRQGTIDLPIKRHPFNRRKFGVFLTGKKAETKYRVLDYFKKGEGQLFSLVELYPKTGRTHQLRVHLKNINRPIVSDPLYGGRKTYRLDKNWCPRLFLHAAWLSFQDPKSAKKLEFSSPLPTDLKESLLKLTQL